MIWTNEHGDERKFTFRDMSLLSKKAANALRAMGIGRGDPVLLMLKRRYEYWLVALGLMRLEQFQIPATHQLQEKDITYRVQAASAKAILCVGEEELAQHVLLFKRSAPNSSAWPAWEDRARVSSISTRFCAPLPKRWRIAIRPRKRT